MLSCFCCSLDNSVSIDFFASSNLSPSSTWQTSPRAQTSCENPLYTSWSTSVGSLFSKIDRRLCVRLKTALGAVLNKSFAPLGICFRPARCVSWMHSFHSRRKAASRRNKSSGHLCAWLCADMYAKAVAAAARTRSETAWSRLVACGKRLVSTFSRHSRTHVMACAAAA